ncbi:MAG: Lipopolysaccharide heptosyltransferase 1 [Chlamydiae bacterium]|nr:Lipopolysaccharide heptosyltransferase 1 [Chlamydiota bacterium]
MRILIVRLSSLGDVITSMVVLQYIKSKYPQAHIEWLVDKRFKEVLENSPNIDKLHALSLKNKYLGHFKSIFQILCLKWKLGKFDVIIDMQGLMKSALLSRCFGRNIVGFNRKSAKESLASLLYKTRTNVSYSEHILKRNFSLFEKSLGVQVSFENLIGKKPYLGFKKPIQNFEPYLSEDKKNILAIIGGSWFSKIYPKESLKEVLCRLNEHILILWSSAEELKRAQWLVNHCPNAILLPKMSLNDVKALITRVDVILGNDTGPTHMAWALNRPSVTILGCTSITRIPETEKNLTVTSKMCVNPSKINKNDTSINEIPPYEIVEAVKCLL